jgi:indole-3-glycerol phosphate synthase
MSGSKQAKRQGTILNEIMHYKRDHLPKRMREVPIADMRALAVVSPPPVDFVGALRKPGVSLIAECKKASPSKGLLVKDYDPVQLASFYLQAGVRAISVLTDARFFQGSLEDLRDVKELILEAGTGNSEAPEIPVLRKDFIFHPYQVYESRAAGADAVLLIAAVLNKGEIEELLSLVHELEMEALVEIHTEVELAMVLDLNPRVIGVNNRDLRTFEVDFANTGRLRDMIPKNVVVVGESGIKEPEDILTMKKIGVDAVLVGETLVRSKNILGKTQELVQAGQEIT